MADGDEAGILPSTTKDTTSLLIVESAAPEGRRIRGGEHSITPSIPAPSAATVHHHHHQRPSSNASASHAPTGQEPFGDRSRKHLTVTFSSARRVGDGNIGTGGSTSGNNENHYVLFSSNGSTGNDTRMTDTFSTSAAAGGSTAVTPKKPPSSTPMSYDNYAGPSPAGPNPGSDLAKFLRDDSIWKDLKVDFVTAEDGNDVFVSDDLLESSTSSSICQGSDRSWSSSTIRNRVDKIRNKCLPTWANIKTFVFVICVLITIHGALATGYTMSVITTIEKRFEISSKTSGLVVSSYEFGSLLSVVFVSYFGSNGHIPRVVGLGGIVLSAGSLLFSLPHLIAPIYVPSNTSGSGGASDTCSVSMIGISRSINGTDVLSTKLTDSCSDSNESYVLILMIAQILLGIGGTPLFTLGTTYIDNHVEKESASVYLAFMYVSMALGPVLGFLLGALMLSEYVNAKVPEFLTSSSPEWVGLWWGGFIVCGILYAISSLPFFLFPRHLTNKRANDEDSEYGRSWKKIPSSVCGLLTNSVYMVATLNACIELAIVTGFTVFLPKYLETQFRVSTSNASVLTGAVAVPGACVGIFFGGWLMKRLKLELQGVATLVILVNVTAMIMMSGFFLFGCGTLEIAGVTVPYGNRNIKNDQPLNLTDPCNANCHCSRAELKSKPVCGADGLTYMSPCFAGCAIATPIVRKQKSIVGDFSQTRYEYSQCSCISMPAMNADDPSSSFTTSTSSMPLNSPQMIAARDGMCDDNCGMLVPFMILVFALSLAASNNQMPIVMVTLRSVSTQEKAFGLGVQVVILRLLSYIPAPIIYGDVIDNTCVLWNSKCGVAEKNCLVYNIYGFRMRFASLSMGLMVAGVLLSVVLWFCIRRRYTPFSPPMTMSEIAHRFGDFDNLHIVRSRKLRSWVSDDSLVNNRPHTPRHQKTRSC